MKNILFGLLILSVLFYSCNKQPRKKFYTPPKIDYSNKTSLDSLIKTTTHSNDTLFLGFTIGMTKSQYKNHIKKLRNEGKTISYSSSNVVSTVAGRINIGAGYTFTTNISVDNNGSTLTGVGEYFLEPNYNADGQLMALNVLPIENWEGYYGFDKPGWLELKIKENSERNLDFNLKRALIDNKFMKSSGFVRIKGNVLIFENLYFIKYIDRKTLFVEMLIKETEKEIIKEENDNIKF